MDDRRNEKRMRMREKAKSVHGKQVRTHPLSLPCRISSFSLFSPPLVLLLLLLNPAALRGDRVSFFLDAGGGRTTSGLEGRIKADDLFEPGFVAVPEQKKWSRHSQSLRLGLGFDREDVAGGTLSLSLSYRPGESEGFRTVGVQPFLSREFTSYGLFENRLSYSWIRGFYTQQSEALISYEHPVFSPGGRRLSLRGGLGVATRELSFLLDQSRLSDTVNLQIYQTYLRREEGILLQAGFRLELSPRFSLQGMAEGSPLMTGPYSHNSMGFTFWRSATPDSSLITYINEEKRAQYRGQWTRFSLELLMKTTEEFDLYLGASEEHRRGAYEKETNRMTDVELQSTKVAPDTWSRSQSIVNSPQQIPELAGDKLVDSRRRSSGEVRFYAGVRVYGVASPP